MKNSFKNYFGLVLVVVITGCGVAGLSSEAKKFIQDYKALVCVSVSTTASVAEKQAALGKMPELMKQMQAMQLKMSPTDSIEFAREMASALTQAQQGKCN